MEPVHLDLCWFLFESAWPLSHLPLGYSGADRLGYGEQVRMHAAILLTHIESQAVWHHFERLKRETRGLLHALLCIHEPSIRYDAQFLKADFRTPQIDIGSVLMLRHTEMLNQGRIIPGFVDLAYMPVLIDHLKEYSHIWILEYDLDYAGHWRDFFEQFAETAVDFIGATLLPRDQCLDWVWWSTFKPPSRVATSHYIRSFGPIVRFSRKMIECYAEAVLEGWSGHAEALFPTIASWNDLKIQDLGGGGRSRRQRCAAKTISTIQRIRVWCQAL